jgi:hypothetical protein
VASSIPSKRGRRLSSSPTTDDLPNQPRWRWACDLGGHSAASTQNQSSHHAPRGVARQVEVTGLLKRSPVGEQVLITRSVMATMKHDSRSRTCAAVETLNCS